MATEYPQQPRWTIPTRRLIIVGALIQLFFIVLGGYYLTQNLGTSSPPLLVRQVLIPEDMVYRDTDVAPKKGKQLPPVDMAKIVLGTPQQIKDGEQLFKEHCATCHGTQGRGDGPTGVTLNPRPRNLTSLEGWKRGARLADIFRTATLGLEGTQMSGFDYLPVEERFALAHYVTSLAPGHPQSAKAALDSLDRQFSLSEGAKEPNTIPVSLAMEKVVGEAKPVPVPPDSVRARALAAQEPRGARVFSDVALAGRLDNVGYVLTADSSWLDNPNRLRTLVASGAPVNGFSPRAELLSGEDWLSLYRYLVLRYRTK